MSKFFLIILLFIPILSFAQQEEVKENQEDVMIYLKTGKSIGHFTNDKNISMSSIGYTRYSGSFIYGIEYSSFFGTTTETRIQNFQVVAGYRHLWTKRFLPYVQFQFGQSSLNIPNTTSYDGIATTLDVGLDVVKIFKIKTSTGVRTTQMIFSNDTIKNGSFTDLYLTFGFVF